MSKVGEVSIDENHKQDIHLQDSCVCNSAIQSNPTLEEVLVSVKEYSKGCSIPKVRPTMVET